MNFELTDYQKQYLAKRKQLIYQLNKDAEKRQAEIKQNYYNNIINDFRICNKQLKRVTNKIDISKIYNWLGNYKKN